MPDGAVDTVVPARKDLLIVGGRIANIEEHIDLGAHGVPDAVEVDCSSRVISPGFIETHHHLWQTKEYMCALLVSVCELIIY